MLLSTSAHCAKATIPESPVQAGDHHMITTAFFHYIVCSWVQLHHCKDIAQLRTDTVTTRELLSSCHLMTASYTATQSTYPPISYNSTTASFKAGARFHHCTPTTSLATVYHSTQICFTPHTPINIHHLHQKLSSHSDQAFVTQLVHNVEYGCAVGYSGPQLPHCCCNLSYMEKYFI